MPNKKHNSTLQKSDSLCKRSTRIAANIVRLSSLCLARISLLPLDVAKQRRLRAGSTEMRTAVAEAGTHVKPWEGEGFDKSSWEARSSPGSYLLESPCEEKKQAQVVREGDGGNVNERAADYIRRIRRRNSHDKSTLAEEAKFIPPPPRPSLSYGRGDYS